MEPMKFPEMTGTLAKTQPQYRALPICEEPTDKPLVQAYTCKYELSDLEIQQIIATRSLYISQFGSFFHPIRPLISSPFRVCNILYHEVTPGIYDFWIKMAEERVFSWHNIPVAEVIPMILEVLDDTTAENLFFIERPNLAIDEGANIINF